MLQNWQVCPQTWRNWNKNRHIVDTLAEHIVPPSWKSTTEDVCERHLRASFERCGSIDSVCQEKKYCESSKDVFLLVGLASKLFSTRCRCQEFLIYDSAVHLVDRPRVNIKPPGPQWGRRATSSWHGQQGAAAVTGIKELGSHLRLSGFFFITRVRRDCISFFSWWGNFIGSMLVCQWGRGGNKELNCFQDGKKSGVVKNNTWTERFQGGRVKQSATTAPSWKGTQTRMSRTRQREHCAARDRNISSNNQKLWAQTPVAAVAMAVKDRAIFFCTSFLFFFFFVFNSGWSEKQLWHCWHAAIRQ